MRPLMVFRHFLLGALILALLVSGAGAAAAQSGSTNGLDRLNDATVQTLMAKAHQQGSVRVILLLNTEYQPEGLLAGSAAVRSQRAAIAREQKALLDSLSGLALEEPYRFKTVPLVVVRLSAQGLQAALDSGRVSRVQEDALDAPTLAESTVVIGATAAWANGSTGAGQTIAILDTGVDQNHEFLAGKVLSEACYSTTEPADGATSLCPGGVSESLAAGSGLPCGLSSANCQHGTHVAGIAAGKGSDFSGVAPDASLIAIQVFSQFENLEKCGSSSPCILSYSSDQIKALERVYELRGTYPIAAVNMSLGGGFYTSPCPDDVRALIIDQLRAAGIATVVAAGNRGYTEALSAPACVPGAISVGSTGDGSGGTTLDGVSSFSNRASFLTLLAPGSVITSAYAGGGFFTMSGTSMAAPHVAGAWAALKSKRPGATLDEIQAALVNTGRPIVINSSGATKPRIQVYQALLALVMPDLTEKIYFPWVSR